MCETLTGVNTRKILLTGRPSWLFLFFKSHLSGVAACDYSEHGNRTKIYEEKFIFFSCNANLEFLNPLDCIFVMTINWRIKGQDMPKERISVVNLNQ